MIYRNFQTGELPLLGLGCMRLPVLDGDDSKIDEGAAFALVDRAMERGIRYYDTAWGYHGGNSELAIGRALKRHPREKFYLADKFPGYDLSNMDKSGYRFINAVSGFATHADPIRRTKNYDENLFLRTVEGNPMIDRAYKMALAAA